MKKANEILEIFDLDGNPIGEQERGEFFREAREEFKTKGKVTRQVKSIRLLMMNKAGRIYLQRRSKTKGENAGLLDKSLVVTLTWVIHLTLQLQKNAQKS